MSRPHTTLVLPDVHVPYQNRLLVRKVCQLAIDIKIDHLILSGDFLDLSSLSRHNRDSLKKLRAISLDREYDAGEKLIRELESAVGGRAKKSFLYGNHEDNFNRFLEAGDNDKLGKALSRPEEAMRLVEHKWEVFTSWKDDSILVGDSLEIIHGQYTTVHAAKKHMDEFEGSVMFGHTHRWQSYVTSRRGSYNIGFLGDCDSDGFSYMPRPQRMKWVNGFAVVYTLPSGGFIPMPVQCWNNQFTFDGKVY